MTDKGTKELGAISKAYLLFYNILQAVGWSYIFIISCIHFSQNGFTPKGLFLAAELPLKIFQSAAVFEILHSAIGLVPSSTSITAIQVASRVIILWPVTHSVKEVQDNISILMFLSAWTVAEIVRYSMYACSLLKYRPYLLQWCRYSFFIVLYPIGVTGEILTIYAALPFVKESQMYSLLLPNKLNFSFSFYIFLICGIASYVPAFPTVYMHMIKQRKKVLGRTCQALEKMD